jgi:hypothetical protein
MHYGEEARAYVGNTGRQVAVHLGSDIFEVEEWLSDSSEKGDGGGRIDMMKHKGLKKIPGRKPRLSDLQYCFVEGGIKSLSG